jgi:SM-20-related protein
MGLDLRLNSNLDLEAYASEFRARGIVQVQDLLASASAEALQQLLVKNTLWRLTFIDQGKPVAYAPDGVRQIGEHAFQEKMRAVAEQARRDYGYCYYSYPMSQAQFQGWDPGHPLHEVTAFLNSEAYLGLGRAITGESRINKVEAMASLYAPGNFLTRHIDHGSNGERRAAYVIGLTPEWHADWGGLLLFYNERKDVLGGFTPRFNVVTIFDTKYEHAVSQVSTFAGGGRYSIAGWFRDDPNVEVFR